MLDYFRKTQFQICKIHQAIDFHREIMRLNGSIFNYCLGYFTANITAVDQASTIKLHTLQAWTHPESERQNDTLQCLSLLRVCVCVNLRKSAHVRARDQLWVSFLCCCPPCSLEQDPSLISKLLLGLDWMVSMSQESSHLSLPNTGIVWTTWPSFTWALGTVLRSLKPACFSKIISYQLQQ